MASVTVITALELVVNGGVRASYILMDISPQILRFLIKRRALTAESPLEIESDTRFMRILSLVFLISSNEVGFLLYFHQSNV